MQVDDGLDGIEAFDPVDFAFGGLEYQVVSFRDAIADLLDFPVEVPIPVPFSGLGGLDHGCETAMAGPVVPFL